MLLKVVGLDPSLRNWGIATGVYDTESKLVAIHSLEVVNPVLPTGKQVRQNSIDLESACQLYRETLKSVAQANAVFAEVPVGSQSARAMASYGVCVGVLGALRAAGNPFFEVTATEVKMAGPGKKTATKSEMIEWAVTKHPAAPWPRYKSNGEALISEAKAEHMADAVAAIYAGIATQQFQSMLSLIK